MAEQPVRGEEALRRMANRALGGSQSLHKGEEKDPIEDARETTRKMMADEIISTQLAKTRAEREEAEAKAAKAKVEREKAESGESGVREPAMKIGGEISFGKIDYQEILKTQAAEREELRKDAEDQARTQSGMNETLRQQLHDKDIQIIQTGFNAQIQALTKLIEANAGRGSFMDQYNVTKELAAQMGFISPGSVSTDLQTTLELKRIEFEQNLELRKYSREEKRADRDFQRQLRVDEDERESKRAEAARQAKRDEMFANAPKTIGAAIARGLAESGSEGVAEVPKGKSRSVEAGAGESGEVECPSCQQPIGIGPTARVAVCANCGTRLSVKRKEGEIETEEE